MIPLRPISLVIAAGRMKVEARPSGPDAIRVAPARIAPGVLPTVTIVASRFARNVPVSPAGNLG